MLMKKLFKNLFVVLTSLALGISILATKAEASNEKNNDLIIVNKAYNKMVFINDGFIEMVAPVGTGRTWDLTPVGQFKVVNMVKNRPYYKKNIAGGSPNNPLGARWIGFSVPGNWGTETGNVFALHGTNQPASIGGYVSSGCIRMYNSDIIKLYDKVANGTPVTITYSYKSFQALAKMYGYSIKGFR
ncbi:L,D-transpeptidase [Domibacillus indicus]|nr:L,D-transpeptidase [Domibacillus indicus]